MCLKPSFMPGSFHLSFFVIFGDEVTKISCHFQAKTVQLIFSFFVIYEKRKWDETLTCCDTTAGFREIFAKFIFSEYILAGFDNILRICYSWDIPRTPQSLKKISQFIRHYYSVTSNKKINIGKKLETNRYMKKSSSD